MTTFTPLGADLFGEPVRSSQDQGPLGKRFLIPPFSVLNTREGIWQERKAAWIGLGIKSELGRDASPGGSARPACDYSNRERGTGSGRAIAGSEAGQAQAKTFNCGTRMAKRRAGRGATKLVPPSLTPFSVNWPIAGSALRAARFSIRLPAAASVASWPASWGCGTTASI